MDQPESTESEPSETQPVAELVGDLAVELGTLVKQELALAAAELEHKAHDAMTHLGRMIIGGALGALSVFVFAAALVLGLGQALPLWLAAGVIAAAFGTAAYAVFRSGWAALNAMSIVPTETLASVRTLATTLKKKRAKPRKEPL